MAWGLALPSRWFSSNGVQLTGARLNAPYHEKVVSRQHDGHDSSEIDFDQLWHWVSGRGVHVFFQV